jgi:CRISPR-associated endonuclease Csn1
MQQSQQRPYRLGLDLGTNSIGWFVVWLEAQETNWKPTGLGPGGVRIFPDGRDPQSGTSNAVDRRTARGARRRRDRYLRRQRDLMQVLIEHGLMPPNEAERKALEALDPYELRAAALDAALPLHHFGRTLFHLAQRRGFKSNRKSDAKSEEKGAIKEGASRLRSAMLESGARTLGEFLWRRHCNRQSVRARNRGSAATAAYDFYPTRDLLEAEFDALWQAQAAHCTALTDALREELQDIVFYQRPLRPPPVGKCALDPASDASDRDGFRAPWALPLVQRFRIAQEVRNLEVAETGQRPRRLSKEEGDRVMLALLGQHKLPFDKIRALLKLPAEARFNLESERRTEMKGDETAARLSHKSYFGKAWRGLSLDRQNEIVEKLLDEQLADDNLLAWLQSDCGLPGPAAETAAGARLPEGHCRLGRRALRSIVPLMQEGGSRYFEAATAAYGDHAKLPTGEVSATGRLPYYGEWLPDSVVGTGDPRFAGERRHGRVTNPTVHIGLNQTRKVVNAILAAYGPPKQVVVELTRELKLTDEEKQRREAEQRDNERRNGERRKLLTDHGQRDSMTNMLKLRLWEELNAKDPLDRRCPFTGEQISLSRLLSEEVEIEHLIPFSDCLDDSAANKVVCMRWANKAKGKRTPFEAFGTNPRIDGAVYDWNAIAARATALPGNKRWRFEPEAREHFARQGGFLGRQLNETGWLARMAKTYLSAVCNPYEVWVLPGRLTAMLRGKWGLNQLLPDHNFTDAKNRADHRHHAIDAVVAALTDRSLLQRMASAYDEERDRVVVPEPWEGFRDELDARLRTMIVSHKPDHGAQGKLHEDTAYGLVKAPEVEGANLVYRKPILALNENEIARIRDVRLREKLQAFVKEQAAVGVKLSEALGLFADPERNPDPHFRHGLRHVRLLKAEKPEYLVTAKDRSGAPYKAMSAGQNLYVDIYELEDGKWQGEAVTVFDANRARTVPRWRAAYPQARLVMRVHKGDLIALERNGIREVMVVRRLEPSANRLRLVPHNEAGDFVRRHAAADDPFRWFMPSYSTLRECKAEVVRIDELGRVWRISAR